MSSFTRALVRAPRSSQRIARALSAIRALVGIGACLVATDASAEPRTAALGWTRLPGAEACIGTVELAASVEARLGRALLVPPAQAAHALEGRVEARGERGGFRAVIALSDRSGALLGERTIETESERCRDLDPDLVLAISLLLDPEASLSGSGEAKASPSSPSPSPSSSLPLPSSSPSSSAAPPAAPAVPERASTSPRLARVYAEMGPIAGIGMVPGIDEDAVAIGYVARVTVPFRWVGFDVEVAIWPSHTISGGYLDGAASLVVRSTRIQVQHAFCGTFALHSRVALFPCTGISVGLLSTRPTELRFDQVLADVVSGLRASVRIAGPLLLGIDAAAHLPLRPWSAGVFKSPPVAATGSITAGWAFE